jgi:hypothetical protein
MLDHGYSAVKSRGKTTGKVQFTPYGLSKEESPSDSKARRSRAFYRWIPDLKVTVYDRRRATMMLVVLGECR